MDGLVINGISTVVSSIVVWPRSFPNVASITTKTEKGIFCIHFDEHEKKIKRSGLPMAYDFELKLNNIHLHICQVWKV